MVHKPKRFKSPENLEKVRNMPCVACGKPPPNDPAHIKSRGSGGGDFLWNLMPLDRKCHSLQHSMGWFRFALEYPAVTFWLYHHGWEIVGRRVVRARIEEF